MADYKLDRRTSLSPEEVDALKAEALGTDIVTALRVTGNCPTCRARHP